MFDVHLGSLYMCPKIVWRAPVLTGMLDVYSEGTSVRSLNIIIWVLKSFMGIDSFSFL